VSYALETGGGVLPVTITSMGNPHCSVFVDDFATIDWISLGREIESNPLFPHRTNVEFVKVLSQRQIEVRFWERGVGQTMSSGTGSSAAVVAAILNGHTGRRFACGRWQETWKLSGPRVGSQSHRPCLQNRRRHFLLRLDGSGNPLVLRRANPFALTRHGYEADW